MDTLDKLLEFLTDHLGVSRETAAWVVFPLLLLGLFVGILEAAEKAFGLSEDASRVVAGWVLFVWILWLLLAPRLIKERGGSVRPWVLVAVLLGTVAVLFGSLIEIWIVRGDPSLRVPFVIVAAALFAISLLFQRASPVELARWSGFVALTAAAVGVYSWSEWHPWSAASFAPDSIGVLVSRFDLDDKDQFRAGFTEEFESVLSSDPSLRSRVVLHAVDEPIEGNNWDDKFQEAHKIGGRVNASVVVFGTVTNRGLFAKIAVLQAPLGISVSDMVLTPKEIGDIPSVDVHKTYLVAEATAGLSYLFEGSCGKALDEFQQLGTGQGSEKDVFQSETLTYYKAHALICQGEETGNKDKVAAAASLFEQSKSASDPHLHVMAVLGEGLAYRRLSEYENSAANLQKAIQAYNGALGQIPADAPPELLPAIQADLGVSYEKLSELEDGESNLNQALSNHQKSIDGFPQEVLPMIAAMERNNRGVVFFKLSPYGDQQKKLESAISDYRSALQLISPENSRAQQLWALINSNLGDAYARLAQYSDRDANIDKAQQAIEESLKYVSPQRFVPVFAEDQFKLGNVYLMQAASAGSEQYRKALGSLACSLVQFDKLGMQKANIVARRLTELRNTDGSKVFMTSLQYAYFPTGCGANFEGTISILKKQTQLNARVAPGR